MSNPALKTKKLKAFYYSDKSVVALRFGTSHENASSDSIISPSSPSSLSPPHTKLVEPGLMQHEGQRKRQKVLPLPTQPGSRR